MFNATAKAISERVTQPETIISFHKTTDGETGCIESWTVIETSNETYKWTLEELCRRYPEKVTNTGFTTEPTRQYILPDEFIELAITAGVMQ